MLAKVKYAVKKAELTKIKILHLLVSYFAINLLAGTLHEYVHYAVLLLVGGQGYIEGFSCVATVLPSTPFAIFLWYISAGIVVSILAYAYSFFEEDPEDHFVLITTSINQLIYGVGEAFLYEYIPIYNFFQVVSIIVPILYAAYLLLKMEVVI